MRIQGPNRSHLLASLPVLFFILAVWGCGGGGGVESTAYSSKGSGALAVRVSWPGMPASEQPPGYSARAANMNCDGLSSVEAQVYGPAPEHRLLASGGPWECRIGQGRIDNIPATSGCTLVLVVRDTAGQIAYHGVGENLDILAGQTTMADIAALPFLPSALTPDDGTETNAVDLGWATVAGAASYEIRVSQNGDLDGYTAHRATMPTFSVPGLTGSTTYYWQVLAMDGYGNIGAGSDIRSFRLALDVPLPEAPADGFVVTTNNVTCRWSEVSDSSYRISIATDREMTDFIVDAPVAAAEYTFSDLAAHTAYYWQVCAVNANGPGNPSVIRSFSTFVGPQLETPVAGQVLPKEIIQLSWEAYSGAASVRYEVILSHSQDMGDMGARIIKAETDDTYYTPEAGLFSDDQTYYWRVIAYVESGERGFPSAVGDFKTLGRPVAELPSAGDTLFSKPFNFSWTDTNHGGGYRIVISPNSDFGGAVVDTVRIANTFSVSLHDDYLSYGSDYYWRVYALDSHNQHHEGYASDIRQIRIFGVPSTVFPADRADVPNGGFDLQWSPVENAARYHVYFRKSNTQSIAPVVVEGATRFEISRFNLSDAQTYSWRVSAVDARGNEGARSAEVSFTTEDAVRVTDVNTNPPNSGTTPDTFGAGAYKDMAVFDNYIFFAGYDGEEQGLYRTDGTPGNLTRVGNYIYPNELTRAYGGLYFTAQVPHDSRLHLFRIEDSETLEVTPVYPPQAEQTSEYLLGDKSHLLFQNRLFYCVWYSEGERSTENRCSMWYTTDGTASNTHPMAFSDSIANPYAMPLSYITAPTGGRFFFTTFGHYWLSNERRDFWASHYPLQTATRLTTDGGPWDVIFSLVGDLNGVLFFFAYDSPQTNTGARHLWRSDGTPQGTSILVRDISGEGVAAKKNGIIYFWAQDPNDGHGYLHMWRTDGTTAGTYSIEDPSTGNRIRSGLHTYSPGPYIAVLGDYLYFRHDSETVGDELHRSTGTYDSLELVYNLPSGSQGSAGSSGIPDFVLAIDGKIYFRGNIAQSSAIDDHDRLCISDGTRQGSYWIDICGSYPCPSGSYYTANRVGFPVASNDGVIFFPASGYADAGRELWRHKPYHPD